MCALSLESGRKKKKNGGTERVKGLCIDRNTATPVAISYRRLRGTAGGCLCQHEDFPANSSPGCSANRSAQHDRTTSMDHFEHFKCTGTPTQRPRRDGVFEQAEIGVPEPKHLIMLPAGGA
ncbi:hypothetical protein ILYODFUR_017531 [Ilyodon furcidens]|uniref:Uncharacterized protein n=1 Tax=Ilyodon furcidens TaxID=33524 RepID=A0ABV0UKY6_9TELE